MRSGEWASGERGGAASEMPSGHPAQRLVGGDYPNNRLCAQLAIDELDAKKARAGDEIGGRNLQRIVGGFGGELLDHMTAIVGTSGRGGLAAGVGGIGGDKSGGLEPAVLRRWHP